MGQRVVEQRLLGQRLLRRRELERLAMNGRRLSTAAVAYIAGVSGAAVMGAIALSRVGGSGALVGTFVILTGLGMLAHAFPIQGIRHQAYQVTLPFIITAAALFSATQLV